MESKTLIGHEKIYQNLIQYFTHRISSSSWIIAGNKSMGKYLIVKNLVNHILSCDITYKTNPDVMIIKPTINKEIGIDEIRNISKFIKLSPIATKYKIIIIDDSDMLNINAANALLKMLEEPRNCIFFLICHNLAKLPNTITSRCNKIKIKNLSTEESLKIILNNDNDVDQLQIKKILILSQNSQDLALRLYKINILEKYYNFLKIISSLEILDLNNINKWYDSFKENDQWKIFTLQLNRFIIQMIKYNYQNDNYKIDFTIELEKEVIEKIYLQCHIEKIIDLWDKLQILLRETIASYLDQKQAILVIFQSIQMHCGFKNNE